MAAGPLLPRAIEELSELPAAAHERAVASQILLNLKHVLGRKPKRTPEEQEFIVSMQNIVEKLLDEGRDEGQLAGVRLSLRRILSLRKLAPSGAEETRIDTCTDLTTLERWIDQAMTAQSVAEALRTGASEAVRRAAPRRRRSKSSS